MSRLLDVLQNFICLPKLPIFSSKAGLARSLFLLLSYTQLFGVVVLSLFFTSCSKGCLYVQQERVDRKYLASFHVSTPDPRLANPPCGDSILVQWRFPEHLFCKELRFHLQVLFWDHSEEERELIHLTRQGTTRFFFSLQEARGRVMTYKLQVLDSHNQLVDEWVHKLWIQSMTL